MSNLSINGRRGNEDNVTPERKVGALIVAAGEGRRMESSGRKIFSPLGGVPILVRTMQVFERCDRIQNLYPVLRKEDIEIWHRQILSRFCFEKTGPPIPGGSSRQDSVRLGLEAITEDIDVVLIHDGVRPFVDPATLGRLLNAMEHNQAAVLAVPAKETTKIVSRSGHIEETPSREHIWQIQTPQAFEFGLILEAHRKALHHGITATDDSTLVQRLDVPVSVVEGSYRNIKITTPEDLSIARAFLGSWDEVQ